MEKEKPRKGFKVNEGRIYANKFYPYYYTTSENIKDIKVNVVPIAYYTRYQAKFTLQGQFGKHWHRVLHIASGRQILERGWELGKNSVWVDGKRYQVKKFHIPPEYAYNRGQRYVYIRKLRNIIKDGKKSNINRFLKQYLIWSL